MNHAKTDCPKKMQELDAYGYFPKMIFEFICHCHENELPLFITEKDDYYPIIKFLELKNFVTTLDVKRDILAIKPQDCNCGL